MGWLGSSRPPGRRRPQRRTPPPSGLLRWGLRRLKPPPTPATRVAPGVRPGAKCRISPAKGLGNPVPFVQPDGTDDATPAVATIVVGCHNGRYHIASPPSHPWLGLIASVGGGGRSHRGIR